MGCETLRELLEIIVKSANKALFAGKCHICFRYMYM